MLSVNRPLRIVIAGLLLLILGAGVAVAQDDDEPETPANQIAYGEEVESRITNAVFEEVYTFDGEAGDLVVIEMMREDDTSGLDPYLSLATLDNTLLTSNDDVFNLNSRIIFELPRSETYQIVAARLSGRFGSGEGAYTLMLDKVEPLGEGVTSEGTISSDDSPPIVTFVAEDAGAYTITYRHVSGDYYPGLVVARFSGDYTYPEEVARIDGFELDTGTVTINLTTDAVYTLTLGQSNYNYVSEPETALYTIKVEQMEERR